MIAWQGGLAKTDVYVYERTFISEGGYIRLVVDTVYVTDGVTVAGSVAGSVVVSVIVSVVVFIVSVAVSIELDEHEDGDSDVSGPKKPK